MSHVYVLVELEAGQSGKLSPVTAELITAARALGAVSAVVVSESSLGLAPQLAELGAAQVVEATAADYSQRILTPEVDALHALGAANPAPIVIAATPAGNEIAGRVAARLASGALANVSAINPDGSAKHSIFGGSVEVSATAAGSCPVYTVRPGAVKADPQPAEGAVAPMPLPAGTDRDAVVTSFQPAKASLRPDISQAKVVVAGGRGVEDNFASVVEPLADALDAAVGSTRDAVDLGYYDSASQIGQTGVTVSPDLYIGMGISGAIQHTSGMQTSGTIVVINQDQDEPFFQIADLGVVGDLHEIAPALAAEINSRRA
ncbi:electron transfer flavoprotein subunit alpha [Corynebacterium phocae]|uniref:Electron transfer flavoprotein subunit alpha n=1 Tax=Corynebacterium phocae TaxID=161895 RepID=A0A1L7D3V1_9CORY|nr:electron transfer flavoprotein subunit alpha/FixB family protein [Corynebacterium phocae]APT92747.1 electron transfer flavoprotein subunit alpha [Corynebacterium phocae]KAA8723058.1 electron transfer flavoprotein subunit alpha/FixB family protein [Corynebacterium phocae]